ncbi:peptide chain release factor 1 [Thermosipho sp. 1063]|uniref:peptide chain release factor 1 n=1 Tax=unclassified Thermosipho (in: thermotogales) TaxID=2676525 RepID=UPI0009493B31|nr:MULTISPECIES: peptide chain release factor 1 [unclassified Thermosipho (in: thermotogales)]ANQ54301.1 peptide chain release factor 1 [Thermosipho sp. 1070]APT72746.1 peptide chain release factor 1 [Thermosipho sp. 1063]OOC42135.1 peptide chain release factor 1 [Thermosipho sp. 1074]
MENIKIVKQINEWSTKTLKNLEEKLSSQLSPEEIKEYSEKYSKMKEIVELSKKYIEFEEEKELWKEEMPEGYDLEIAKLDKDQEKIVQELITLVLPKNEYTGKNVFLEIRAGTGGDEAALFAADLLRMYLRYVEKKGFKAEIIDENQTDLGGYKEVIVKIKGKNVGNLLKYESGVHRVQRVPSTESGGRIHTSTATVAVLPEVSNVEIEINPTDLRIDTYRASGAGGQYVNKTESAVRITHIPTGIVVTCQSERSQLQNKEQAMNILRARLYKLKLEEQSRKISSNRKSQIGSGERSEKIRTYNFPQNRVTDHRINYTSYNLQGVLDGDLDDFITRLMRVDMLEQIENIIKGGNQNEN